MPAAKVMEQSGHRWERPALTFLSRGEPLLWVVIGIHLQSQGQWSNNWRAAAGRSKQLRMKAVHALAPIEVQEVTRFLGGPARRLRFVRLAPRRLDDDNLAAVFKPIRDQVCCWLKGDNTPSARADDGKRSGYTFEYGQQQQKSYGVRIEVYGGTD